jgi:hypothetical protein
MELPDNIFHPASAQPPNLDAIRELLGMFAPVIKCVAKAKWKATQLDDFGISLPGLETVPVGVTVCLSRPCMDRLKEAVTTSVGGFLPALVAAMAAGGTAPIIAALELTSVAGTVIGAGVTIGQVLVPAVLVLAAHGALIAGQLMLHDTLGNAANGVCLNYPALPAIVTGVLNPVVGLVMLANTPVIVTPR